MAGFISVGYFLLSLFFSLILLVFWLRLFLRYYRVSLLHPAGKLIYQVTDPLIKPLEALLVQKNTPLPRYDWLCLCYIIVLEALKCLLFALLFYQVSLSLGSLLLYVIAALIIEPCNLLFYALLIRVILSWLNPMWQKHPAADLLKIITNPLIRMGHRIIPNTSGFDFAPFVMMIILKVIVLFITASLPLPLI